MGGQAPEGPLIGRRPALSLCAPSPGRWQATPCRRLEGRRRASRPDQRCPSAPTRITLPGLPGQSPRLGPAGPPPPGHDSATAPPTRRHRVSRTGHSGCSSTTTLPPPPSRSASPRRPPPRVRRRPGRTRRLEGPAARRSRRTAHRRLLDVLDHGSAAPVVAEESRAGRRRVPGLATASGGTHGGLDRPHPGGVRGAPAAEAPERGVRADATAPAAVRPGSHTRSARQAVTRA